MFSSTLKHPTFPTNLEGLIPQHENLNNLDCNHVVVGDGYCDDYYNWGVCSFDNGDCCLENINTLFCRWQKTFSLTKVSFLVLSTFLSVFANVFLWIILFWMKRFAFMNLSLAMDNVMILQIAKSVHLTEVSSWMYFLHSFLPKRNLSPLTVLVSLITLIIIVWLLSKKLAKLL